MLYALYLLCTNTEETQKTKIGQTPGRTCNPTARVELLMKTNFEQLKTTVNAQTVHY